MKEVLRTQFNKLTQPTVRKESDRQTKFREARWRCVSFQAAFWSDQEFDDAFAAWVAAGRPKCVTVFRGVHDSPRSVTIQPRTTE